MCHSQVDMKWYWIHGHSAKFRENKQQIFDAMSIQIPISHVRSGFKTTWHNPQHRASMLCYAKLNPSSCEHWWQISFKTEGIESWNSAWGITLQAGFKYSNTKRRWILVQALWWRSFASSSGNLEPQIWNDESKNQISAPGSKTIDTGVQFHLTAQLAFILHQPPPSVVKERRNTHGNNQHSLAMGKTH